MLAPLPHHEDLRTVLDDLLASGTTTNPALNDLVDSYARYHAAFVVVGGLFLLGFALLAALSWRRLRSTPEHGSRPRRFERATYFAFFSASAVMSLLMAVLVVANLGNAVSTSGGLAGSVSSIGTPPVGSRSAKLHEALAAWLRSGQAARPAVIDVRIEDRLAWQRPKAIICTLLLILVVVLAATIWRKLIHRSRHDAVWTRRGGALLALGLLLGPVTLVLMAMVIGNTQAALAPLSMTLLFG